MSYKNFSDIPFVTQIIVGAIGILGAWSNYLRRDLKNLSFLQKLHLFLMDTITSSVIAMIVFFSCVGYGLNELLSVGIAGAVAHQGTRALYILELLVLEKLEADKTFEELRRLYGFRKKDSERDKKE